MVAMGSAVLEQVTDPMAWLIACVVGIRIKQSMSPFPSILEMRAVQGKTWEPFVSRFSTGRNRGVSLSKSRETETLSKKSLMASELPILIISKAQVYLVTSEIRILLTLSPFHKLV